MSETDAVQILAQAQSLLMIYSMILFDKMFQSVPRLTKHKTRSSQVNQRSDSSNFETIFLVT